MPHVRVEDMVADEFFDRYKDEIKAIRKELGEVLHRRMFGDERGGRLLFMLSMYGLQETLSALIATFVKDPQARQAFCDMLPQMVMSDINGMLKDYPDRASGVH